MQRAYRLAAAGVVTFLLGLIILFPARVAYEMFVPDGVAVSGLSGSIWRGSARELSAGGIYVRDIEWRVKPLALLGGRFAVAVEAAPSGGFVEADVSLGLGGSIRMTDLNASLSLNSLSDLVGMGALSGTANARFERLEFEDNFPVNANGSVELANVFAAVVAREPIGGYLAEFQSADGVITASVEDTDGVFDIAGQLQLTPDRNYLFLGLVAPKDTTPARQREQMRFLGSPNERGQYELRLEGQL